MLKKICSVILPNRQKNSRLDCKRGDKTSNNGRILETNICGWTRDIYCTRHCFNRCSCCGSRPRGWWCKRMRGENKSWGKKEKKMTAVFISTQEEVHSADTDFYISSSAFLCTRGLWGLPWPVLGQFLASNQTHEKEDSDNDTEKKPPKTESRSKWQKWLTLIKNLPSVASQFHRKISSLLHLTCA